jgi:hypothetical protein
MTHELVTERRRHPKELPMTNRVKVLTALTATVALPLAAALALPSALAVPVALLVPFVTLVQLETLPRNALAH